MRLVIAAVGRLKAGPDRNLAERYRERIAKVGPVMGFPRIEVIEVSESRAREPDRRKTEEAIALAQLIPEAAARIVLDERGNDLTSTAFSQKLQGWRDQGRPAAVFLIGGPDGLAPSLR